MPEAATVGEDGRPPATREQPGAHGLGTRLAHLLLAAAALGQLATSSLMDVPRPGQPEPTSFLAHVSVGLLALGAVALFWIVVVARRGGTPLAALFPWFSGDRLRAAASDARGVAASLVRLRLPGRDEAAALAPAVHGLGVLAMTAAALTGALGYFADAEAVRGLHAALVKLVWVYLGGHVAMGAVHQLAGHGRLGHMLLLRPVAPAALPGGGGTGEARRP